MSGKLVAHMDVVVKYHLCTTLTATKFASGILKEHYKGVHYFFLQSVAFSSLLWLRAMQGVSG